MKVLHKWYLPPWKVNGKRVLTKTATTYLFENLVGSEATAGGCVTTCSACYLLSGCDSPQAGTLWHSSPKSLGERMGRCFGCLLWRPINNKVY